MTEILHLLSNQAFARAWQGLLLAGLCMPLFGVVLLQLDVAAMRFAVTHAALLGAALGMLAGIDPFATALAGGVAAGLFALPPRPAAPGVQSQGKAGPGAALITTLCAAASLFLFYRANINTAHVFYLFWGNILALEAADLWLLGLLVAIAVFGLFFWFRRVQLCLCDADYARSLGRRPGLVLRVLLAVASLGLAASLRLTGALLVDALTILPALAARTRARSLGGWMLRSVIYGLVCNLVGFGISLLVDVPASAAIAFCGGLMVLIAHLRAPKPVPRRDE